MSSLYIFRLFHPQNEGFTHGIYLRLTGYAPRGLLERFIQESVALFTGRRLELRAVSPCIKKNTSLFDYLQTLYVAPANLLVTYSNRRDAICGSLDIVDHTSVGCLKDRI